MADHNINTSQSGWTAEKRKEAQLRATTHGMRHTPEYLAYQSAKARCIRPKNAQYKNYGERGIEFRFTSFEQFYAELGDRPSSQHSLDRKNVHGHYELGNCQWSTRRRQARNTQKTVWLTMGGITLSVADWADATGMKVHTIYGRKEYYGWCDKCALTLPMNSRCPHKAPSTSHA